MVVVALDPETPLIRYSLPPVNPGWDLFTTQPIVAAIYLSLQVTDLSPQLL